VIRIRVLAFPIREFFKFHSYSVRTFTLLIDLAMRNVPLFKPVLVGRALTIYSVCDCGRAIEGGFCIYQMEVSMCQLAEFQPPISLFLLVQEFQK
jgi:hypothetical protein